jgi:serine/threonine-protein kinase HipA
VEAISDSIADAVPLVQEKMTEHAEFRGVGKRMLLAWQEGVHGLREKQVYASGEWPGDRALEGISDAPKLATPSTATGRSPLMADRSKRPKSEGKRITFAESSA